MNNRKNQNSLLVLATLGVYLGLVLAGATPQILAQVALQLKPDSDLVGLYPCPNNALINGETSKDIKPFDFDLSKRFNQLIDTTRARLEIVNSDDSKHIYTYPFFFTQIDYAPYINKKGVRVGDDWHNDSSDWASAAHAGQIVQFHSYFLTPLADCKSLESSKIRLTSSLFRMDENGAQLELVVRRDSQSRADSLANFLNALFVDRSSTASKSTKLIYENTKAEARSREVYIVTRLPRAGLDSLLASDAK